MKINLLIYVDGTILSGITYRINVTGIKKIPIKMKNIPNKIKRVERTKPNQKYD